MVKKRNNNPLSDARRKRDSDLWHRKSGSGYALFVEYYGCQPMGTVCGKEVVQNPGRAILESGSQGMSRAAKKRRKKKGSENVGEPSAVVQNSKLMETTRQGKAEQLLEAFHIQPQHKHLTAFVEALARPLPITFRLRANNVQAKMHSAKLCEVKEELEKLLEFVKPVSWDLNIYQSKEIEKSKLGEKCPKLKQILLEASSTGLLARQELGSMLPVIGLELGQHLRQGQTILDTCASPGSKTLQALEVVVKFCETKDKLIGKVVANDVHPQRIETLKESIGRSGILSTILDRITFSNHDASKYPSSDTSLDVVVVDVPCSGDGTARKDSSVLPGWSPATAHALHPLQFRILCKALELVKVGGVVSYSTCSLNPVENEAVVQGALLACGPGNVELLEWPCPDGLILRPGLTNWRVAHYDGNDEIDGHRLSWFDTPSGMLNGIATFWPRADNKGLNLDRCRRLWPQDQDTGGFFVALIKKTKDFKRFSKQKFSS